MLSDITSSGEGDVDAFVEITPDSLLHNIQSDILDLENRAVMGVTAEEFERSDTKRRLDPDDRSITVHVCHSAQREVEVLHDQLLAMLQDDPDLTPRDIVVMVADIDSYSPFIQAVFGSATESATCLMPSLTVGLASLTRPCRHSLPCCHCLTAASFPKMSALLDVPVLAARFNINEEGLRYLRQWVNESGVRWGSMTTTYRSLSFPYRAAHGSLV